jgi:hypothetical protein
VGWITQLPLVEIYFRRDLKNRFITSPHCSAITPPKVSDLPNKFGSNRLNPNLGSDAPQTTLPNLAHWIAPAHIKHGSMVT